MGFVTAVAAPPVMVCALAEVGFRFAAVLPRPTQQDPT